MEDWIVVGVILGVGVSMLPLAIDVANALFPQKKLMRATSTIIQPVLLAFVLSLSAAGLYFFLNSYFLFTLFLDDPLLSRLTPCSGLELILAKCSISPSFLMRNSSRAWFHLIFAIWTWINVVYNFVSAVVTDAGSRYNPSVVKYLSLCDDSTPICTKPDCALGNGSNKKPATFRHCRVCRTCVAYLDHHCPFTGNCVGANNYIFFYLFLTYCSIGLAYALILSSRAFLLCVLFIPSFPSDLERDWCGNMGTAALLSLPVAAGLIAVGSLFLFHSLLLVFDRTTLQFCKAFPKNASWFSIRCWGEALGLNLRNSSSLDTKSKKTRVHRQVSGKLWELRCGLQPWHLLIPVDLYKLLRPYWACQTFNLSNLFDLEKKVSANKQKDE